MKWLMMQPIIKDHIAYYVPQGFIDGNNAPLILDPIGLEQTAARGVERIAVSLERVVAFNNRGIAYFAQMFQSAQEKYGLKSALYGYSPKLYEQINRFFGDETPVDLFESGRVMALFLGRSERSTRVLLFAQNALQAGLMTVRIKELGYEKCEVAKQRGEFLTRSESGQYDVVVDRSRLAQSGLSPERTTRGNTVIYTVSTNLDEFVENFDGRYHQGSLSVGFSRFVFEASQLRVVTPKGIDFLTTLSVDAAEYGASIVLAGVKKSQIPQNLLDSLNDAGVETVPDFAELMKGKEEAAGGAALRKFKPPAKELVSKVGIFADATVHTLEALSGIKAVRGAVAVAPFAADGRTPLVAAACGFYGDYTGLVVLAFPHGTLRKACRFLMGEDIPGDALPQAAADLSAIIMNRIVKVLHEQKAKIDTTQPRTFGDLASLEQMLHQRRGVMAHIAFEDETFYFFLSR